MTILCLVACEIYAEIMKGGTFSRSRLSRPASMKAVSVEKSLGGVPRLAVRYSVTMCRMAANSGMSWMLSDASAITMRAERCSVRRGFVRTPHAFLTMCIALQHP